MKTKTALLVIALLGFSVVFIPQGAVGITPSTNSLFVGGTPTSSPIVLLGGDLGESMDRIIKFEPKGESFTDDQLNISTSKEDFTVTVSGVGFPAEEDSDLDGGLDSTDNCIDSPNGEDGGTWRKGEIGVILLFIGSLLLLGL